MNEYEQQRQQWREAMERASMQEAQWQKEYERSIAINERTEKLLDRLEAWLDRQGA